MSINESESEILSPASAVPPQPINGRDDGMSIIEQAALNPQLDIERMERLEQMYLRKQQREAYQAYILALSQADFPIIEKRGRIAYPGKDGRNRDTAYALWEDIHEQIKPVLRRLTLALSFRIHNETPDAPTGNVKVTCVLEHAQGHRETTSLVLPYDNSGAKNAPQSIVSSISYGKRTTAGALLDFVAREEDDDGSAAGAGAKLNAEQIEKLKVRIREVGANEDVFLTYLGGRLERAIATLEDLPATAYGEALDALNAKERQMKKRASNV